MRYAIITPNCVNYDAVSNDVVTQYYWLKQSHQVTLYTLHNSTSTPSKSLLDYQEADSCIYHHSIGVQDIVSVLANSASKLIVRFHNITPPHYFDKISYNHYLCELGYHQLQQLRALTNNWVSNSNYSREMVGVGEVIAPLHTIDELLVQPPSAKFDFLVDSDVVLMIGRVVPSKGIITAIRAFSVYRSINQMAKLVIVGGVGPDYLKLLTVVVSKLNLSDSVVFTGKLSTLDLAAVYGLAMVVLFTSYHEGFGVAALEAGAWGVPVVGVPVGGLSEAAGPGFVGCERNLEQLAAGLDYAIKNRTRLGELGQIHYQSGFTNRRLLSRWGTLID